MTVVYFFLSSSRTPGDQSILQKLREKLTKILNLDINECVNETDNCHENAECSNNDGSFSCLCNVGYSGNGTICQGMLPILGLLQLLIVI